ncbi:hypothetical protein ACWD9K_37650 [Streptomyces sp. 900116325]
MNPTEPQAMQGIGTKSPALRARRRRALFSGIGIAVVLALVVGLGVQLLSTRQQSQDTEALASSRALAQASRQAVSTDPVRSAMLALAAYQTSPSQEARNQLLRAYLRNSRSSRALSGVGTIREFQASRDGNVMLATSYQGGAMLFVRGASGNVRNVPVPSANGVWYPMVSADGKRAGYLRDDGRPAWFSVRADASQPVGQVHTLPDAPEPVTKPEDFGRSSMSLDGTMIVSRIRGSLVWWNLDSNTVGGSVPAPAGEAAGVWIGADNRTLLTELGELGWTGESDSQSLVTVDMATGATRTVVSRADSLHLSGDRTAVAVCRTQPGQAVTRLLRIADGAQQGVPYLEKDKDSTTKICTTDAADTTGRRVVLGYDGTLRMVDLTQNKVISSVPAADGRYDQLASADGRLFALQATGPEITYTELRTGVALRDVNDQKLTHDGSKTIKILADGSGLQLRPSGADAYRVLAEAPRRKPYWSPSEEKDKLQLSDDGKLLADRDGWNVVTIREVSTLRQTAQITALEPPLRPKRLLPGPEAGKWAFSYFFDHDGNLVTVSGAHVQQWDLRTGRQRAHLNTNILYPAKAATHRPDTVIGPYPASNKIFAITLGDPVIRIVDVTTARTTDTVKTTDDALGVQFDPSGRYFALLRRGLVIELWRRNPLRREIGPLITQSDWSTTPWISDFLDRDGRYLLAANNTIRIYRLGERGYQDSYEFGDELNNGVLVDTSHDGRTAIYGVPGDGNDRVRGGIISLDPQAWQRDLCSIIGYRQFTSDEQDSLPTRLPVQPICAVD